MSEAEIEVPADISAMYLSTNVFFELDDLFQSLTVLSTNSNLPGYKHEILPSIKDLLKRFWIVTAENPFSQKQTKAQNAALMEKLANDLIQRGIRYEPVTCKSADGLWEEQSFAVPRQPHLKANEVEDLVIALAGKYLQNSVFSFYGNTMKILPVLRTDIRGQSRYFVYGARDGR